MGKKNLKVLDVGCGVGNISLQIANIGCDVTGIDVDKSSVDYANKRNKMKNCRFKVYNAHKMNMNEKFDIIICSEVLEHLKYPENLIEFISKSLKKTGFLFLSVPNGYGPAELSVMPRRIIGKILKRIKLYEICRNIRHAIVRDPVKKAQKSFGLDTLNQYGEGAMHEQFFTLGELRKLFDKYNLEIIRRQKSFVLVGTFPFYYLYSRFRTLQSIDCRIADVLPAFTVSGWSFIIKFKN